METPEAQCPGAHTCELALYPFAGPWWEGGVVEVAEAFTLPPYAQTATAQASTQWWLELSPPLLLSSLKRAEERGSLIVRVWNPAPQAVSGVLRLGLSCVEAYAVSLAEVRIEPLTLTDAALDLTLRSKEVLTLEFVLGEEVTMPR
jgi:alpha-mannosidase